jgi:hypothetical protein
VPAKILKENPLSLVLETEVGKMQAVPNIATQPNFRFLVSIEGSIQWLARSAQQFNGVGHELGAVDSLRIIDPSFTLLKICVMGDGNRFFRRYLLGKIAQPLFKRRSCPITQAGGRNWIAAAATRPIRC